MFLYPYSALELGAFRGLRFVDMLFASAELADPLERLVQVMAWAMTSSENEECVRGVEEWWAAHPSPAQVQQEALQSRARRGADYVGGRRAQWPYLFPR